MIKIVILTLLCSSIVNAADIDLNSGDTVTINAGKRMTVSCNGENEGNGILCEKAAEAVKSGLRVINDPGDLETYWHKFKESYPNCALYGVQACMSRCVDISHYKDQCPNRCQ